MAGMNLVTEIVETKELVKSLRGSIDRLSKIADKTPTTSPRFDDVTGALVDAHRELSLESTYLECLQYQLARSG